MTTSYFKTRFKIALHKEDVQLFSDTSNVVIHSSKAEDHEVYFCDIEITTYEAFVEFLSELDLKVEDLLGA